jgi:hypothetical protein
MQLGCDRPVAGDAADRRSPLEVPDQDGIEGRPGGDPDIAVTPVAVTGSVGCQCRQTGLFEV